GNYRIQPIFVKDVAKVVMKSITEKKFLNKILDVVVDDIVIYNHSNNEFIRFRIIKIRNIDFEHAYHEAMHNSGPFAVDDLNILVGNYVSNHKKLKRISGITFTRYKDVLKSSSFS